MEYEIRNLLALGLPFLDFEVSTDLCARALLYRVIITFTSTVVVNYLKFGRFRENEVGGGPHPQNFGGPSAKY